MRGGRVVRNGCWGREENGEAQIRKPAVGFFGGEKRIGGGRESKKQRGKTRREKRGKR